MAEIKIQADQRRLIESHSIPLSEDERLVRFDSLLSILSKLYQKKYEVPEPDISTILTDFHASGNSEPLQINTWWTPTENWPVDRMLEVGSLQIALAIHYLNLPENMMVTSTIEQKGVDPRFNKTVFVMGYIDDAGSILVIQEKPQLDDFGQQIVIDGKPQYESVEVRCDQSYLQELMNGLTESIDAELPT